MLIGYPSGLNGKQSYEWAKITNQNKAIINYNH